MLVVLLFDHNQKSLKSPKSKLSAKVVDDLEGHEAASSFLKNGWDATVAHVGRKSWQVWQVWPAVS